MKRFLLALALLVLASPAFAWQSPYTQHPSASSLIDDTAISSTKTWSSSQIVANTGVVNVKSYGAIGNGSTDDAAAIQAAVDAAAAAGGGTVFVPGSYIYSVGDKIVMKTGVHFYCPSHAIIKLASGVNKTVLEGENYTSLSGGSSSSGIYNFGAIGCVIDGNKANNASPGANEGHGIAFYGHQFIFDDVTVLNTARKCIAPEYNGSSHNADGVNGTVYNSEFIRCNETGIDNEVSDSHYSGIRINGAGSGAVNTYDGYYGGRSARIDNINIWSSEGTNFTRNAMYLDGDGSTVNNAHLEAGATSNLLMDGLHNSATNIFSYNARGNRNIIVAGNYNKLSATATPGFWAGTYGVELGSATYGAAEENDIEFRSTGMTGGALNISNDTGGNRIVLRGQHSSAPTTYTGTAHSTTTIDDLMRSSSSLRTNQKSAMGTSAATGSTSGNAALTTSALMTITPSAAGQGMRLDGSYTSAGTYYKQLNASSLSYFLYPHTSGNIVGLGTNIPAIVRPGGAVIADRGASNGWNVQTSLMTSTVAITAAGAIDIGAVNTTLSNASGSTYAVTLAAPNAALVAEMRPMVISMIAGDATNSVTLALTNIIDPGGATVSATFAAAADVLVLLPIQTGASTYKWLIIAKNGVVLA